MGAKVVETARLQPGKCAITKDTKGPFIDTGTNVHRWGRVYLSIQGLRDVLRAEGFLVPEESEAMREDNERLQDEVRRLTAIEDDYRTLVDSVKPHIEVEPEIVETEVTVLRDPTDKEIEAWIKREGGNHPAVRAAQPLEKGSSEEWRKIYGDIPPGHPKFVREGKRAIADQQVDGGGQIVEPTATSDANIIVIHDQEVDLNKVLDQNVNDVLGWAEGHDETVHGALFHAEYAIAKSEDRKPRKGVIEGLGYEYLSLEDYEAAYAEEESEGTTSEDEETIDLEDESDEDEGELEGDDTEDDDEDEEE